MPDAQEIKNLLKTFSEEVHKYSNYDEAKKKLDSFIPSGIIFGDDFHNTPFYFKQHQWSGQNVVYRCRRNDKNNAPYSHVSNISYAPEEELKNIVRGRVNKPGESIFYGATKFETACFEVVFKQDSFKIGNTTQLTVGVWKFEKPMRFAKIPYSLNGYKKFFENVNIKPPAKDIQDVIRDNDQIKKRIGNDLEFEVLMFFADAFANFRIRNDADYYITNFYSEKIFSHHAGFDGIIYPSVANAFGELNIALKPASVKEKLSFIWADHCGVISDIKNSGKIDQVNFIPYQRRAKCDDEGNLQWPYKTRSLL